MNIGKSIIIFPNFSNTFEWKVKERFSIEALHKYSSWYPFFFYEWGITIKSRT